MSILEAYEGVTVGLVSALWRGVAVWCGMGLVMWALGMARRVR